MEIRGIFTDIYKSVPFDFARAASTLNGMLFQTVQLLYWLALATWFGSVLFIAMAAPIIFRTVRENNPILSHVLSVNLEGQHSTLLAGSIVFNLVQRLLQVEVICAGMLLITLIAQPFVIDLAGGNRASVAVRSILFVAATALVYFDWQHVWPKIQTSRSTYLDHADEPEIANPAKDRFDTEQRKSLSLLSIVAVLLMGLILFSATISAPPRFSLQVVSGAAK